MALTPNQLENLHSCLTWSEKENSTSKISTNSIELDSLIGGGIETNSIYEAFGENATGKTQIGYQLAVNNFLMDKNNITLVLDTELRFKANRIKEIAKANGFNEKKIKNLLESIKKVNVMDTDQLLEYVKAIENYIKEGSNIKLVIIDSLIAHFRAEFTGRKKLTERQGKLAVILHTLNKLCKTYNFAVYMTNHAQTQPDKLFGDPTIHLGGNIVGHFSEYRLYLRKGKKGSRVAKLIDSPGSPDGEALFSIQEEGIKDF